MEDSKAGIDYWLRAGLVPPDAADASEWASDLGVMAVKAMCAPTGPTSSTPKPARTCASHKPGATEAELDRMVEEFLETVGRTMGE